MSECAIKGCERESAGEAQTILRHFILEEGRRPMVELCKHHLDLFKASIQARNRRIGP